MNALDRIRANRQSAGTAQPPLPLAPAPQPEPPAPAVPVEDLADFAPVPVEDLAPLVANLGETTLDLGEFRPEPVKVGLSANSILVNLTVHFWTAKKKDDDATKATNAAAGAKDDAGAYIKNILDPKLLEAPATAASKVRTYIESKTIIWQRGGIRLLPAVKLAEFKSEVRRLISEFDQTVVILLSQYASARDDDRARLGTMFVEHEYPSVEEVRRRYGINVDYFPVPEAGHFLVDLQQEEVQRLRDGFQDTYNRALDAMRQDLAERMAAPLRHLAAKLRDYGKVVQPDGKVKTVGQFRDSTVENIREAVETLRVYNVAGDEDLATIAEEVARDIAPHAAETLRQDDWQREQTAKRAEEIVSKMSALFG